MKNLFFTLTLIIVCHFAFGQKAYDKTYKFQTENTKMVSIYEPTNYKKGTPNAVMLALHPWNVNRWNSKSWRDTLISFAETNGLILICPDGGADGQVDDQIDLDFTNAMLDSVQKWYSVDTNRIFCMGFSWGGKTTYTYGLGKPETFCGYIPIGAAISVREVALVKANADKKPIYIVHGQSDALPTRFTPLKKAMEDNGGYVHSFVHTSGHTIDFPNRNNELNKAFQWVDSVCTASVNPIDTTGKDTTNNDTTTTGIHLIKKQEMKFYPVPVRAGETITIETLNKEFQQFTIIDIQGKVVSEGEVSSTIKAPAQKGNYVILLSNSYEEIRRKILVE